jgi:phosphoglycerate dehydrogenase-like enzyme
MFRPAETKIVLCIWHKFDQWRVPDWLVREVRARYPTLRVVHLPTYDGLEKEIEDADIFCGFNLKPEQLARARKLKWIHCLAAGVNQLMRDDVRAASVIVTNSRHVHAPAMAEHALSLILALARRLPSAARYQSEKFWAQQEIWNEQPPPTEIGGRTLVIVGYGAIGQELGRRARACGMRIVGVKRDPSRGAEHADKIIAAGALGSVLPEADFVVLAAPVTPETEHFFGRAQFAAMKPAAYFLNISRGALVDERALVEALREKRIAGAAMDVAEVEPLPPENPLWDAPNLLITPHLAGVSERLWPRHAELLFENLERYFSGRELLNVVDKIRGY